MIVDAEVRHIRIQSDELAALSKTLGGLGQELEDVRRRLALQSGFSAQIASLRAIFSAAETHRQHLSGCAQALSEISALYERTERSTEDRFAESAVRYQPDRLHYANLSGLNEQLLNILYGR